LVLTGGWGLHSRGMDRVAGVNDPCLFVCTRFLAESSILTVVIGVLCFAAMAVLPLPDFVPHPIVAGASIAAAVDFREEFHE
jgi:hypothetical protein